MKNGIFLYNFNMNNLKEYISEKLKINKETNSNKSFDKLKNLIKDWLEDHSWFDLNEDQFNIEPLKDDGISLEFPPNSNPASLIERIGLDICTEIDKQLHLDYYWSADKENNKLTFSDSMF